MIDGYGRQVYMDFRIELETADGIWARLAAELNGRGTPDPWKIDNGNTGSGRSTRPWTPLPVPISSSRWHSGYAGAADRPGR